jgi:hypothetical protein
MMDWLYQIELHLFHQLLILADQYGIGTHNPVCFYGCHVRQASDFGETFDRLIQIQILVWLVIFNILFHSLIKSLVPALQSVPLQYLRRPDVHASLTPPGSSQQTPRTIIGKKTHHVEL